MFHLRVGSISYRTKTNRFYQLTDSDLRDGGDPVLREGVRYATRVSRFDSVVGVVVSEVIGGVVVFDKGLGTSVSGIKFKRPVLLDMFFVERCVGRAYVACQPGAPKFISTP